MAVSGAGAGSNGGARLAEVCAVLSLATDVAVGQPVESGLRAALIAVGIGRAVGLDQDATRDLLYLSLVRMAGCTSTPEAMGSLGDVRALGTRIDALGVDFGDLRTSMPVVLRHVTDGLSPLAMVPRVVRLAGMTPSSVATMQRGHCEVAERLADRLRLGPAVAESLAFVYERWDGKGRPAGARGPAIPLLARIMNVAYHVEMHHRLGGMVAAVDMARSRSGAALDPDVVAAFTADAGAILAVLDGTSPWAAVLGAEPEPWREIDDAGVDVAATVLSDFSEIWPWSKGHGRRVAALVDAASGAADLGTDAPADVRRAALVHDLGALHLNPLTLDQPGPLSDLQWEDVRLHAYHSERIVTRATSLRRAGEIAGRHHERPDGGGYHRGLPPRDTPPASRLVAAADVFDALIHARPHRGAFAPDAAAAEMEQMAQQELLDPKAVSAVLGAAGRAPARPLAPRPDGLTEREVEVLREVARGCSIKQAARELDISPKTVDGHLQRVYAKIGVSTRAAATLYAVEHDLLEP
jgi:HD-GYP domain-containing protein (c-di-GMP phosphodiesterase class II)